MHDSQKVERMKESLHFIGAAPANKHVVFVDSAAEAKQFSAAKYFDTPAALLDRSFNRPRRAQLESAAMTNGQTIEPERLER